MIINLAGLLFLSCIVDISSVEVPEGTNWFGESYLQSFEIKGEKR